MKRGDLITVVTTGDHGKPRPAVVIQTDALKSSATTLVCLFSSDTDKTSDSRILIEPTPANGLRKPSLILVEKIYPIPQPKCGPTIGSLDASQMAELDARLTFVLGLAD